MFRLEESSYLHLGWFIFPALLVLLYFIRWRLSSINLFAQKSLHEHLMPLAGKGRIFVKYSCWFLGFSFLVFGLSNPQFGTRQETISQKGSEVIICLDVSASMRATDLAPNRLDAAKKAVGRLLSKLEGDRVGLVVFSCQSFVQLPLTADHQTARLFIDPISVEMLSAQGTAIGSAIELAIKSFSNSGAGKTIILITDGENHEDDAVEWAGNAASQGIQVHCVGVGSDAGVPIPLSNGSSFLKDDEGNTVVTKLNKSLLSDIAKAGNGLMLFATSNQFGIDQISDAVSHMKQAELDSRRFTDYESHFTLFLLPAFCLFLLESLISERKSYFWKKWSRH